MDAEERDGHIDEIEVGNMVAVAADDENGKPLYVAKVFGVEKTGDVHNITIHWWYTDNDCAFEGRYVPEYEAVAPQATSRKGRRKAKNVQKIQVLNILETTVLAYGFSLTRSKNLNGATIRLLHRKLFECRSRPGEETGAPADPAESGEDSEADGSEELDAAESSPASTDVEVHLAGGLESDEEPYLGPRYIVNMPSS